MTETTISISGTVDRTFFSSPTFSAGKLRQKTAGAAVSEAGTHSFTVKQQVNSGDTLTLHGRWITHATYGQQFEAAFAEYDDLSASPHGLETWLAKNKDVHGVGPTKARRIAEAFGNDFDNVITNTPELVGAVAKLSPEDTKNLRDVWISQRKRHAAMLWLAGYDLSIYEINRILDEFGDGAVGILRADPYQLVYRLDGFGFKKIDKIALKMGIDKSLPSRIDAGIDWCLNDTIQQKGHTYSQRDQLVYDANVLLELDDWESERIIRESVDSMVSRGALWGQGDEYDYVVSPRRIFTAEQELWMFFTNNGYNPVFGNNASTSTDTIADLNPQQANAVKTAVTHRISLITGGAGTGKTYTVSALIRAYVDEAQSDPEHIVLCAPTGKASRRIEETTKYSASTIHRLLGWNGRSYTRPIVGEWCGSSSTCKEDAATRTLCAQSHENMSDFCDNDYYESPADVVIIDECSMVDSTLAHALFSRISPDTAVVLVGDHNQLPPVGPGNFFRDLIDHSAAPITVLDTVVRQAGALKNNCCAILNGTMVRQDATEPTGFVPWQVLDDFPDADSCFQWILNAFTSILTQYESLDLVRDLQILTPTHERALGTRAINIGLQRIAQRVRYSTDVPDTPENRSPRLFTGDKIIQTKNNYQTGIMNGTLGQVVDIDSKGHTWVQFEGADAPTEIEPDRRFDVQLAYAMTIHKSQGSEFPFVIAVIHKSHSFMHTRNLIYTACTRAKHKLIIVGDMWGVRNSIKEIDKTYRKTILAKYLRGELQ